MLDLSPRTREGIAHLLGQVDTAAQKWARRAAAGHRPLTVEERDRLRALIDNLRATLALAQDDAQITAWTLTELRPLWDAATGHLADLETVAATALAPFAAEPTLTTSTAAAAIDSITRRSQDAITHDWSRLTTDTQRAIADAVTRNHLAGDNPERTANELARAIGHEIERAHHRARVIMRTEAKQVYDDVSQVMFTENANAITGWKWDARTDACRICLALDGRLFPPTAPMLSHHMCRCVPVPVLPDDRKYQNVTPGDWPADHPDPDTQADRALIGLQPNARWREYWAIDTTGNRNLRRPRYSPELDS